MHKRRYIIVVAVFLVSSLFLLGFNAALSAPPAVSAKALEGPANTVEIDFTYDPSTGSYSIGGIPAAQLKALGLPLLDKNALKMLSEFGDLHLALDGSQVNVSMLDGTRLATINWDTDSRNTVIGLLENYGVNLNKDSVSRVEEVLMLLNLNLTVRDTPKTSDPLHLALSTLILADIARNGNLSVEGINTGLTVGPDVVRIARAGDIENAIVCLDRGTLKTTVNGDDLPTITFYEEGLEVVDKALNLGLGNKEPFLDTRLGTSLSFDGTHPEGVYCGGED